MDDPHPDAVAGAVNAAAEPASAGADPGTARGATTTAPATASRRLAVRVEDLLLAGWVVLVAPLLAQAAGSAGPFDSGNPIQGLILLVGFAGALVCLATRPAGQSGAGTPGRLLPGSFADRSSADASTAGASGPSVLDSAALGPLIGGLLLVGGSAFAELGLDPAVLFMPTFALVVVLALVQSRLPAISVAARRALITPYVLGAGSIFWGVVHAITGGLNLSAQNLASVPGLSSGVAGIAGVLILGAAVYYTMLIYAPRQIAEREGGPIEWLARFGLFVVSVALGLGWLSLLGG